MVGNAHYLTTLTQYELALRREERCILLVNLHLLKSFNQLTVLGQHQLSLQSRID